VSGAGAEDLIRRHLAGDPEATRLLRAEVVAELEALACNTNKNTVRSARATLKRIPGHPLYEQARAEKAKERRRSGATRSPRPNPTCT